MPAKSKAQQSLMGMAYAYKKGKLKNASGKVKKIANEMSSKDLKKYAETKTKNLPSKVKSESFEIRLNNKLKEL